ncbi:acetylxylan esterase [Arthrobacter sp. ATA002]|uniref:acetylxylan esterase n=1 Tax=Arthrobacter sp. ATA002 TaxID=2991715 RepID=UPI0022A714E2|nr:acetylxylan esterase [Arthrobacter sp. ATA002]WAP51521.1 acetylxylan esterase [Arthrobacter sp. ATA002]
MAQFDLPVDQLHGYRSTEKEPADFNARWDATLSAARRHPTLISVDEADNGLAGVDCWDVRFAGFDGDPVAAWFSRPAGVPASVLLPVVVEYLGYGRGRGLPHERLLWVAAGYAHLLVDSRGQGGLYGSGGDTPDTGPMSPSAPGVVTRGVLDHEQHYYRRLITDAARAVDAARALPGTAPSTVIVAGNSQGGLLSLAAAGLVPDVAACLTSAPFLCHPERALRITEAAPWNELVQYLSVYRDAEAAVMRTLSYVDGVAFARRALAPAHFATGLRDSVCPPSTIFAAFNAYGENSGRDVPHRMEVYPFNHHEGGDAVNTRRQLDWLDTLGLPVPQPSLQRLNG